MKKNKQVFVALMLLLLTITGCHKEELIQPSEPTGQYTLPQGDQAYDQEIVDFYKRYGSYILYKFNEVDFRWNFTTNIKFTAEMADPAYVGSSVDFLQWQLFSYYSSEFLGWVIPYKVLLCQEITKLDPYSLKPVPGYADATWSYSHIAFGHADARWVDFTTAERLRVKGRMHAVLWTSAIARGKLDAISDFTKGIFYNIINNNNYKTYGLFASSVSPYDDIMEYIARITCYTKAEMDAQFLNDAFDPTGIYRRKYQALIAYGKDNYGIDLQAIGNAKIK